MKKFILASLVLGITAVALGFLSLNHSVYAIDTISDVCDNIPGDQVTVPTDYYEEEGDCYPKSPVCADDSYENYGGEDGEFDQDKEIANNELCENTPTVTPEPTQPPNTGGPGDGLSDGRSDGRSSCPECTKAPQGQVLGASTDFAGTGVASDMIMNVVGALGGLSIAAGVMLKKRLSK